MYARRLISVRVIFACHASERGFFFVNYLKERGKNIVNIITFSCDYIGSVFFLKKNEHLDHINDMLIHVPIIEV